MTWADDLPVSEPRRPTPPPPRRRRPRPERPPIPYQTWHLIAVAAAAFLVGMAIDGVIDVHHLAHPPDVTPAPSKP